MKTESDANPTRPVRKRLALAAVLSWCFASAAFFTACSTNHPTSTTEPRQPKVNLARLDPGAILITTRPEPASITIDAPNRRMESAGEGATTAARNVLNTPHIGHPQLEAVVGAVEFVAAPFAAAYGAVNSRLRRLSTNELAVAENNLTETMRISGSSEALLQRVDESARLRTRRLLICSTTNSPVNTGPVSAILEVAVESLQLQAVKPGDKMYSLWIRARARLTRTSDHAVLLDRSYQYHSGESLFVDWARHRGMDAVIETGFQSIAGQIAVDVFQPLSEPPILLGPGRKHSRLSSFKVSHGITKRLQANGLPVDLTATFRPSRLTRHPQRLALRTASKRKSRSWQPGEDSGCDYPSLQFVSYSEDETDAMEIRTSRSDLRLSTTNSLSVTIESEAETDTKWTLDGLEHDRNAVVQAMSCFAAVPIGLWEQTLGAVGKRSREQNERMAIALAEIPRRVRIEQHVADDLAKRLQS
ncbi:MAG TPA: hypothetical protein VEC99_18530, partial [Clostridia bacterium]|nr:hypothetical protein [Clostridia bacterium]